MDMPDIIGVLHDQSNTAVSLVSMYIVVVLGLLGFITSTRPLHLNARILLAVGFSLFAIINLVFVVWIADMITLFTAELNLMTQTSEIKSAELRYFLRHAGLPSLNQIVVVHLAFDAAVVIGILVSPVFTRVSKDVVDAKDFHRGSESQS